MGGVFRVSLVPSLPPGDANPSSVTSLSLHSRAGLGMRGRRNVITKKNTNQKPLSKTSSTKYTACFFRCCAVDHECSPPPAGLVGRILGSGSRHRPTDLIDSPQSQVFLAARLPTLAGACRESTPHPPGVLKTARKRRRMPSLFARAVAHRAGGGCLAGRRPNPGPVAASWSTGWANIPQQPGFRKCQNR